MSDAEVALQKEADASRLALEALKREMNTGDPGNAAAVEAELVEAGTLSQESQDVEMMVKNDEDMSHDPQTLIAPEDNSQESEATGEVVYQVSVNDPALCLLTGPSTTGLCSQNSQIEPIVGMDLYLILSFLGNC